MTNHEDEAADVVVVGSGPSGGVVAHTLATRGFSVVCLEQGDWVNPTDYPANYPEWELLIQAQWGHDPNARRLPADYPLDVSRNCPSAHDGEHANGAARKARRLRQISRSGHTRYGPVRL